MAEDSSQFILSNLAAGPLEDLLVRHGAAFIERAEHCSVEDPKFRAMLGMVWRNEISEAVWLRIQKATGRYH